MSEPVETRKQASNYEDKLSVDERLKEKSDSLIVTVFNEDELDITELIDIEEQGGGKGEINKSKTNSKVEGEPSSPERRLTMMEKVKHRM